MGGGQRLTGARATADGVEEEEALEAGAVVRELADAVEHEVDNLLADRVVATGVVVGGVLLARDELLGVVELAVGARAHLVDHRRLEVDEDGARHVLARAGLREEGVERVVAAADGLVRGHLAIGLDAVLEAANAQNEQRDAAARVDGRVSWGGVVPAARSGRGRGGGHTRCGERREVGKQIWRVVAAGGDAPVELPARVSALHAALSQVDGDDLTHICFSAAGSETSTRVERGRRSPA